MSSNVPKDWFSVSWKIWANFLNEIKVSVSWVSHWIVNQPTSMRASDFKEKSYKKQHDWLQNLWFVNSVDYSVNSDYKIYHHPSFDKYILLRKDKWLVFWNENDFVFDRITEIQVTTDMGTKKHRWALRLKLWDKHFLLKISMKWDMEFVKNITTSDGSFSSKEELLDFIKSKIEPHLTPVTIN